MNRKRMKPDSSAVASRATPAGVSAVAVGRVGTRVRAAALALLLSVSAAGCEEFTGPVLDQCLRTELFHRCLAALPAGPASAHYNDWSEVVSECGQQAAYQSYRRPESIRQECRP